MAKNCSVVPQISNSTRYLDSKLFTEIKNSISLNSNLDNTAIRNETTRVYEYMNSNEFLNMFGNWKLYQRYKFNTMTKSDLVEFNSKYDGNIELLEKSIPIHLLNELYEPIYTTDVKVGNRINETITFRNIEQVNATANKLNMSVEQLTNYLTSIGKTIQYKDIDNVLNSQVILNEFVEYEIYMLSKIVDSIVLSKYEEFDALIQSKDMKKLSNFAQIKRLSDFIVDRLNELRNTVINKLSTNDNIIIDRLNRDYDNLIERLTYIDETNQQFSILLRSIISHFNKNYGINVKDGTEEIELDEISEEDKIINIEEVKSNWNDGHKMRINLKRNVAKSLRLSLARSVNTNFINNINNSVSSEFKYGIKEPISIDELWNTFISISIYNKSKKDVIRELRIQNEYIYEGNLTSFINELESNTQLWNSFKASIMLPVELNKTMKVTLKNSNVNIQEVDNNYRAFAFNVASLSIRNRIINNIENISTYSEPMTKDKNPNLGVDTKVALTKNLINDTNFITRYNNVIKRLNLLGLTGIISIKDIDVYLHSQVGLTSKDGFYPSTESFNYLRESNPNNLEAINNLEKNYKNLIKQLDVALADLMLGIIKSQKDYLAFKKKNTSTNRTFNFSKSLKTKSSIEFLSKIIAYKEYNNVSLSYFNENGDMEYSPQYPSFFTDLRNILIPINKSLDFEFSFRGMSRYIESPYMKNNVFLYNYDGNGLFEIKRDDKGNVLYNQNGTPILSGILNPNYLNTISAFQYSGMKLANTSTGFKYDNIHGESWILQTIQAAMRGQHFIHPSDSSRLYAIQTAVYGTANLLFDNKGNYISVFDILKNIGMYDKGQFKLRTLNDILNENGEIKDDAIFYFNETYNIKENNSKPFYIFTGKEIKEFVNLPKTNLDILRYTVNIFLRNTYISIGSSKNQVSKILENFISNINSYNESELMSIFRDTLKIFFESEIIDSEKIFEYMDSNEYSLTIKDNLSNDLKVAADTLLVYLTSENHSFKENVSQLLYNRFKVTKFINYVSNPETLLELDKFIYNPYSNDISKGKGLYHSFVNSIQVEHIKKAVMTEVEVMQDAALRMFDFNRKTDKNGVTYLSSLSVKLDIQNAANKRTLSSPKYYNGKFSKTTKDKNGRLIESNPEVLKDGKPTGRVFQFLRLSYVENGELINLEKYAINNNYISKDKNALLDLVVNAKTNTHSKRLLDLLIYDFIDNWLSKSQEINLKKLEAISNDLKSMLVNYHPSKVIGTDENANNPKFQSKELDTVSYLVQVPEDRVIINEDNTVEVLEEDSDNIVATRKGHTSEQIDKYYRMKILSAIMTDTINFFNISEDIFLGRQYEYSSSVDYNKRSNQAIRNGKSNELETKYRSLTIADVELVSNMIDKLSQVLDSEEVISRYGQSIEVGNGLSMITVDELITRLESLNQYESLKPYIDNLTNPDLDYKLDDYLHIVEQLKYFMYSRQKSNDIILPDDISSYQEKNSTIVLFPKLFKGSEYEVLINWMVERNINSLNFASGSKVGGSPIFQLHDIYTKTRFENNNPVLYNDGYELKQLTLEDGTIVFDDRIDRTKDYSPDNRINIDEYIVEFERKALRVQQDTVGHLLNEKGIFSTQWIKKLFVNMNDSEEYTFNIDGKKVTYKGRSNDSSNPGLFELFHYALSTNAKHDRDKVLSNWGALENGEIKYTVDGQLDLNYDVVIKYIQDYFYNSGNLPYFRAFDINNNYGTTISPNHNTISKHITQILLAGLSKVANQKIGQMHLVAMPDVFMKPKGLKYAKDLGSIIRDNEISIDNFLDVTMFSFTNEFIEQTKKSGRFELRAEDPTTGEYAQIVVNVWDSQFEEYRKTKIVDGKEVTYIDINEIPKESRIVVGTRIPHEGAQTTFVAEVVGFMNTKSSQVIVPYHLAKRTGWDYDIDTVYIYTKHLYKRDGKLQPISYEYDKLNPDKAYNTYDRMLMNYIQTYYEKDYNKILFERNIKSAHNYDSYINKIKQGYKESYAMFIKLKNAIVNKEKALNSLTVIGKSNVRNKEEQLKLITDKISSYNNTIDTITEKIANQISNLKDTNSAYNLLSQLIPKNNVKKIVDVTVLNGIITAMKNNFTIQLSDYIKSIQYSLSESVSDIGKEYHKLQDKELIDTNPIFLFGKENFESYKKELKDTFNANQKRIKEEFDSKLNELKSRKDIIDNFNKKDSFEKLTRKTRENIIVNIVEARSTSPSSLNYKEKPNEYNNIQQIFNGINKERGLDNKLTNFANTLDRANYAVLNKTIKQMKGIAVINDNTISILGSLGAKFSEEASLPIVIKLSEIINGENFYDVQERISNLVGSKNVVRYEDKLIVFVQNIGNNNSHTWTNINGELITHQSTETLSNILDAVKFPLGFNINPSTISILSLLSNLPINHYTDIYGKEKKPNSFAYGSLLLHQPIVTKYINRINNRSRLETTESNEISLSKTKDDILSKIIYLLGSIDVGNNMNILDVFKRYILDIHKDSETINVKEYINKIDSWNKSISEKKSIIEYSSTNTTFEQVFNDFINFIKSEELGSYTVDNKLFDSKKINSFIKLSSNLVNINYTSNKLFTYSKKDGYRIQAVDLDSYKSIDELHEIYTSSLKNGYYDIDYYYNNLVNTENNKDKINFINFLKSQLDIYKMFSHLNSTSNILSKSNTVFITDKLGASPDTSITNRLFDNMSDMYIDFKRFERDLVGITKEEKQKIRLHYYNLENLKARAEYIKLEIEKYNDLFEASNGKGISKNNINGEVIYYKTTKLKFKNYIVPLYVNGQNIIEVVFPEVINNNLRDKSINQDEKPFDYKNSLYPYMQAQYAYTNNTSLMAFGNILIKEHPIFKRLLKNIITDLGISTFSNKTRLDIENEIVSILENKYLLENVPFYNFNTTDNNELNKHKKRLLGVEEQELKTLNNGVEINKALVEGKLDIAYNKFKDLSVANQLAIMMTFPNAFDLSTKQFNFLKQFELNLNTAERKRNGYHKITMKNNEVDTVKAQLVFFTLYYNDNALVREAARNLIKYSFITSGLKFGNNIAKFIPLSLYYEQPSQNILDTYTELNLPENQLWLHNHQLIQYFNNIANLEYTEDNLNSISGLVLSKMYDNRTLSPLISNVSYAPGSPRFNNSLSLSDNNIIAPIKEETIKLENSYYANKKSIQLTIKGVRYLFKRYDVEGSSITYFYPIKKTLPFDFTIDNSLDFSIELLDNILSENEYIDLIKQDITNQTKSEESEGVQNSTFIYPIDRSITADHLLEFSTENEQYTRLITKSEKTYSETAQDIINESDVILYIGNNSVYKNAFKSEKTIYSGLDNLGVHTLDSILEMKNIRLTIVGDTTSDTGLSQEEFDNKVIKFVRVHIANNDISSVKTIYKKGIGESVFKALYTHNIPLEAIELGVKDNILNSTAINPDNLKESLLSNTYQSYYSFNNIVKDLYSRFSRLYKDMLLHPDARPDRFQVMQQRLEQKYKTLLNEAIELKTLEQSFNVTLELLDKIIEFIMTDRVVINGETFNIFNVNVSKLSSEGYSSDKANLINKLLVYSTLLDTASKVLNMPLVNVPDTVSAEFKTLSKEEKDEILKLKKEITDFNERVANAKRAMAFQSDSDTDPSAIYEIYGDIKESDKEAFRRLNLFQEIKTKVDNKQRSFIATTIYEYTRNPKFKNSKYAKTIKALIDRSFDEETANSEITFTSNELAQLYNELLEYNDDMTKIQLYMDSIRHSGISIIDNMFYLLTEFGLENRNIKDNKTDILVDLVEKYFGGSKNIRKLFEYNAARESKVKNKLIDKETGIFISDYKWSSFYNEIAIARLEIRKHKDLSEVFIKSKADNPTQLKIIYNIAKNEVELDNDFIETSLKKQLTVNSLITFLNQYNGLTVVSEGALEKLNKTIENIKKLPIIGNINGNSVYKIMEYKDGETIREIGIVINFDKRMKHLYNVTYITTDEGLINVQESINIASKKSVLAYDNSVNEYGRLEEILDDTLYDYYFNIYVNENLADNSSKRYHYEKRFKIQFEDSGHKRTPENKNRVSYLFSNEPVHKNDADDLSRRLKIYKVIPNNRFYNPEYNKLSETDKQFISDISDFMFKVVIEVFPEKILEQEFIPYIFIQDKANIKKILKTIFGVKDIHKEDIQIDHLGRPINYIKSDSLTPARIKDIIKIQNIQPGETYNEYIIRILEYANLKLKQYQEKGNYKDIKPFENIKQIQEFNSELIKEAAKQKSDVTNYDIAHTVHFLLDELYSIKTYKEFGSAFAMLKNIVGSEDFHARDTKKSGNLLSFNLFGETKFVNRKGKETNAYRSLEKGDDIIAKVSRTNSRLDQIMGVLLRYTSMNVMWFNWSTGVKNVMKGLSDMIIEASGGELITNKELGNGMNLYLKNIPNLITYLNSKNILSKEVALLHEFESIFQDATEGRLKKQSGGLANKLVNGLEATGYGIMTGGEHFMQMSMMFTVLLSHRFVNGMIMSRHEYISDRLYKVVSKVLPEEFKQRLDIFIEEQSVKETYKYRPYNLTEEWINRNILELNTELRNKLVTEIKNTKEKALKEFEGVKIKGSKDTIGGYKRIYDLVEFKDNKLIWNEEISPQQRTLLTSRIRRLNQSMHGVYNTIDRNALQSTLMGEVVMQFRKWMWSTWTRYMGSRTNLAIFKRKHNEDFDESLNRYRIGAFKQLLHFITKPLYTAYLSNKKDKITNPRAMAFITQFKAMGDVVSYWKLTWHTLTANEQANVRRGAQFFLNTTIISLALLSMGLFKDDEDDEGWFYNRMVWILAGLQTEHTDIIPLIGWANFYRRTKENVVPMERQLSSLANLMYDISAYPFRDESERIYTRGQYAGESRISINTQKLIPIWRQIFKEKYISSQVNYYNMYNPLMNILN